MEMKAAALQSYAAFPLRGCKVIKPAETLIDIRRDFAVPRGASIHRSLRYEE